MKKRDLRNTVIKSNADLYTASEIIHYASVGAGYLDLLQFTSQFIPSVPKHPNKSVKLPKNQFYVLCSLAYLFLTSLLRGGIIGKI